MTATPERTAILIWDAEGEPPQGDWTVLLWRSYHTGGQKDVISVPQLVEDNAESLRAQYLAWVYDLGETKINGQRVVDHLELRPGFSYWWMTLLAQKCTYAQSPHVYHVVRLLACEHLCRTPNYQRIKLVTAEPMLAAEIGDWCAAHDRSFEQVILPSRAPKQSFLRTLIGRLPVVLRGTGFICNYLARRFHFGPRIAPAQMASDDAIIFVDILVHFDAKAAAAGAFKSGYWTSLTHLIRKTGWAVNWAHFYYRHRATPDITAAGATISKLNQGIGTTGRHFLLDEHYGFGCFARTLVDFSKLLRRTLRIWRMPACYPKGSRFTFRHLLHGDWIDSLVGQSAADNLCILNGVEAFIGSIPRQRLGVYIQENQPWEIALLHAWRAAGHGLIIGTPHTTIRFWDLRYFHDRRVFTGQAHGNTLPLPDKMALNGPAAFAAYETGLGPVDRFLEVEALRYIPADRKPVAAEQDTGNQKTIDKPTVLLVATDLLDVNIRTQLDWLTRATANAADHYEIIVRPHPASDFCKRKYPDWQNRVDRSNLAELLARVDVVFVSNASSVAVDAYMAKKPVITVLDGARFNFSPLRGLPGATTVASAQELEATLRFLDKNSSAQTSSYMCLEDGLARWQALLS